MKAISLWQPWAVCIPLGIKEYETRSWATNYRGPILIHATQKQFRDILPTLESETLEVLSNYFVTKDRKLSNDQFAYGCILGMANLIDCIEMTTEFIKQQNPNEIALGIWQVGRFAWKMENPVMFDHTIRARGFQRIWNYNGELPEIKD